MCVSCWAGVTYLRYTVLTSPKKGETAVHCCDPTLSVLVMLVCRNVFHVVSALQFIACSYTDHENRVAWVSISMHVCECGSVPRVMVLRLTALEAAGVPL